MPTVSGLAFRQGQHICALYSTPEEQLSVASAYIAAGVAQNERCLYAAPSSEALDRFRRKLQDVGTDCDDAESRGALLLRTKHEAHLADGYFDTERMLAMLNGAVEDALNAGFVGLRTCGDMTWLLDNARGSDQVVEYEALLNQFFRQTRATGMCQYDLARLPVGLLDHAGLCAHPSVILAHTHMDNPFCLASPAMPRGNANFEVKLARLRTRALVPRE